MAAAIKSMQARQRRLSAKDAAATATQYLLTEPGDSSKYESVQMWRDNVVDVGRDETYRFLEIVFGDLGAMYECGGYQTRERSPRWR